jgi:hypothetical protein
VISHSFAFSASRRLEFSYKSIIPCTAFPSTFVSMLELSPPLPVFLLLRVGGLSRLNTRAVLVYLATCEHIHFNVDDKSNNNVEHIKKQLFQNVGTRGSVVD